MAMGTSLYTKFLRSNACKLATASATFNQGDNHGHFPVNSGLDQRPPQAKDSDSAARETGKEKKQRVQQDPYAGVLNSGARSSFSSAANLVN